VAARNLFNDPPRLPLVAPSILSADFADLGAECRGVLAEGAHLLHLDVMDGHFVPNLTVGPLIVRAVRRASSLPIDVHLMIENADRYLDAFADAGASWISLHAEALPHLQRAVAHLRARGVSPGVALNPSTPLASLDEVLPELDYVLVMSVNPGFGGQSFLPASLDKIRRLRERIRERGLAVRIEVDGGVDVGNARSLVEAGAEILVAGSAVFGKADSEAAVRALLEACR
jgi:ribulose-phosphate 3-epimerase